MGSFNGTITYEGTEPTQEHIDQAVRCAMDARQLKDTAGLSRMTKAYELPDGAQVYVLDYEHVWKVHIVPPTGYAAGGQLLDPIKTPPGEGPPQIIGVVSGVTASGELEYREIDWQYPDEEGAPVGAVPTHRAVVRPVKDTGDLFTPDEVSHKIAIEPFPTFVQQDDPITRTQLHFVQPGHYTGGMSALVQLLMGVGRKVEPDYEERWLEQNPRESTASGTEDEDFKLYPDQVQISFDPRWNRTHGLVWGDGNTGNEVAFIVEMSPRGVAFMPVALDEFSETDRGKEQYEKVYPKLNRYRPFKAGTATLFEAFGGFPRPDNIPAAAVDYERYIRAGKVMRAPQGAESFYEDTLPFCTYFGWAFHHSKPRAANTGYRTIDGKKIGVCYEARFTIEEKAEGAKIRNPLLNETIAALQLTEEIDLFKAERLPEEFAQQMVDEPDYDEFDAFVVEPDWNVSCNTYLLREGCIDYHHNQCPGQPDIDAPGVIRPDVPVYPHQPFYSSGSWQNINPAFGECDVIPSPHFKFYEPFLGAVVGFDFSLPQHERINFESADGPIFCTYTHKGIEILNYFHRVPQGIGQPEWYNTRAACQFTGRWYSGWNASKSNTLGYFYSTSKDFRKQVYSGAGNRTVHTGKRIGYRDYMEFCAFFAMHGSLRRHYFGNEEYTTEQWGGRDYLVSVMCASHNRSAFFVAVEEIEYGVSTSQGETGGGLIGVSGAFKYGHLYHWAAHWAGVCTPPDDYPDAESTCRFTVHWSGVDNPESCFGVDLPTNVDYSICPMSSTSNEPKVSTFDGQTREGQHAVYSGYYNNNVSGWPEAWSEGTSAGRKFKWQIWGMGIERMNARLLREETEIYDEGTDIDLIPLRASDAGWWRCANPYDCPVSEYPLAVNYFGPEHVTAYHDLDLSDTVSFGTKLSVPMNPYSIPFGVVD